MTTSHTTVSPALHPPVERFRGSHSGIVAGLDQLRRLPALTEALRQARDSADAALALFEHQVVPHHLDEERELFTSVVESAAPGAEQARAQELVAQLVAQHRHIEQQWSDLRPSVLAIAAGKFKDAPGIDGAVADLVASYADHARLEEQTFLPLADEILSRDPRHMAGLDLTRHARHVPMPPVAYM